MGLSASQAKLLSITSRISTIELRSQDITRAKTSLSNQIDEAHTNYINALNKTNLTYLSYDSMGNKVTSALTGSLLTTYAPLKNQYGLINSSGQILLSEKDAANYEASNNLNEFLAKYGIEQIESGETITIENPAYKGAYEKWEQDYAEWQSQKPDKTNEKYWETVTETENSIYKQFTEGTAGGCYTMFINPCSGGYLSVVHACDVLVHMLELGEHVTTNGDIFTVLPDGAGGDYETHWWTEGSQQESINNVGGSPIIMEQLRDAIKDKYACGEHECDEEHFIDCPASWGGCGDKHEVSCATNTPCDETQLLVDKIEDIYYEFRRRLTQKEPQYELNLTNPEDQDLYNRVIHLVEHDLKVALESQVIFNEELYNEDLKKWEDREPQKPDIPATIEEKVYTYEDGDKAQWYVNLWHRVNGASDNKNGTGKYTDDGEEIISTIPNRNYDILEDGLMNNSAWLQRALEQGAITLERVNFDAKPEANTGLKNVTWTSIIYTNALDIGEEKDETQLAQIEQKFEQKSKELENKDKQYDNILKQLDTEHSALEAEYDSVKSVINNNIEKTLKIYSA